MKNTTYFVKSIGQQMEGAVGQIETRRDVFWSAVALIGICMCLYIYFVTTTVRNVVAKQQLSVQASGVEQNLSGKQFALIQMKNNLTMAYAQSLGFTEAQDKVFITPTSVSVITPDNSTI